MPRREVELPEALCNITYLASVVETGEKFWEFFSFLSNNSANDAYYTKRNYYVYYSRTHI